MAAEGGDAAASFEVETGRGIRGVGSAQRPRGSSPDHISQPDPGLGPPDLGNAMYRWNATN